MTPTGAGDRSGGRASMGPSPTKRLVFGSDLNDSANILRMVMEDVEAHGFGEDAVFAIRLSLDEALSNAIRHGNNGNPEKQVVVEYGFTEQAFSVSITDEGSGFSPDELPDPTQKENLERPCGRGVMLMKAYMSHVSFNKQGNRVTLVKKRNCPLPVRTKR